MKWTLTTLFLATLSASTFAADVMIKLEGGGITGTFVVTTNEISCGRLNWDGVPDKDRNMSGGQYEISVQMVNDEIVLKEMTLAAHKGIRSDITAKTIVPLSKLPWTGKVSQTSVKLYRKGQEPKEDKESQPPAGGDGKPAPQP